MTLPVATRITAVLAASLGHRAHGRRGRRLAWARQRKLARPTGHRAVRDRLGDLDELPASPGTRE